MAKSLLWMAVALLPLSSQAGPVLDRGASREFQINIHEANDQRIPSAASDETGTSWWRGNRWVRRPRLGRPFPFVPARGEVSEEESRVKDFTGGRQDGQHVAALGPGGFVIAWNGAGCREEPQGIHAGHLDASGRPLASDRIVGGLSDGFEMLPRVGSAIDGSYLVAWGGRGIVDDTFSILGQRMSYKDASQGSLIEISQRENTRQRGVDLARGRQACKPGLKGQGPLQVPLRPSDSSRSSQRSRCRSLLPATPPTKQRRTGRMPQKCRMLRLRFL